MSLFITLFRRAAETLKPRAQSDTESIWDRKLDGDAWIGVFLIVVALLGFYEVSQNLF